MGASPSRFVRFIDALTKLHQWSGPSDHAWSLPFAFRASMFNDVGLFIEVTPGGRRRKSVEHWEGLAEGLLFPDAINREKGKEEADRMDEQIFLGFLISTAEISIALHEEGRA